MECDFRFLKDPLFLASSVFVKKPERVVALGFIMVLCLLVYVSPNNACASASLRRARHPLAGWQNHRPDHDALGLPVL